MQLLSVIAKIKNNKTRKIVLKDIGKDEKIYSALKEMALNTLNKNIKLNRNQRNKLSRVTPLLRKFKKNNSKNQKHKLIIQSGGILPIIVPAALSLLSTILSNGIRRKN